MSQQTRCKRKILFVDPAFQGQTLMRLAVYWVLYHIVLFHSMFLYHVSVYRRALETGDTIPQTFFQLYTNFAFAHTSLVVCAVLAFPLILWDMLKMTHRIAGPLVRFRRTVEMMKNGHTIERVQLRNGDFLTAFQKTFNEFLPYYNTVKDKAEKFDAMHQERQYTPEEEVISELKKLKDSLEEYENQHLRPTVKVADPD